MSDKLESGAGGGLRLGEGSGTCGAHRQHGDELGMSSWHAAIVLFVASLGEIAPLVGLPAQRR